MRQLLYLRALGTIPNIRIVYGHFLTTRVTMPLAGCPPGARQTARVIKTEDLLELVRIVRHELGRTVGILNPHRNPSRMLLRHATFVKSIRKGVLAASQFPAVLHDAHGRFTKPASW